MYALDDVLVATDLLENSDTLVDSGSGLYATFYKQSPRWGFKVYRHKFVRDDNYEDALRLAEAGIGPKVGRKFSCVVNRGQYKENVYGFTMECIDITLYDYARKTGRYIGPWRKNQYLSKIRSKLKKSAEKIGLEFNDNHTGNIGAKLDENYNPIKWLIIDAGG